MKIPKGVDFSNIKEKKIFDSSSKEYKTLISMNDDWEWKEYVNTMLSEGISVIYDASGDFFIAKPVAFKENSNKMQSKNKSKLTLDDFNFLNEDLNFSGSGDYNYLEDLDENYMLPGHGSDVPNSASNEFSIGETVLLPNGEQKQIADIKDDTLIFGDGTTEFWAYVEHLQDEGKELNEGDYPWDDCIRDQKKKYGSKETAKKVCGSIKAKAHESKSSNKKSIKEDHKKYLLYDNEDELENDELELANTEDILDIESPSSDLISLDDQVFDQTSNNELEVDNETVIEPQMGVEPINSNNNFVTYDDLKRLVSEMLSGHQAAEDQVQVDDKFHTGEAGTVEQTTDRGNDILASEFAETQEDVANVEDKINNEDSYLDYLQGDNNEINETGGEEFEVYEEPLTDVSAVVDEDIIEENDDLEVLSPADYEDGDLDVKEPAEIVKTGSTVNYRGIPVKVQITGWLITVPEVNSLAETVYKSGGKLRKLISENTNRLSLIVERSKKFYKIIYEDKSKTQTQKPWKVGKLVFSSLQEAVRKVSRIKISNKEKFFKKLIAENKDLVNRELTHLKEADIFEDCRNDKNSINYISGWNVKSVGELNLKYGLNEVYSKITDGSKSANTLFKTKDGKYYLLKGNLGEASQKGTKKHIVDLEGKKDYGVGQVVGIYENTLKGLGQVMYKIQRTSIPLLVWKRK